MDVNWLEDLVSLSGTGSFTRSAEQRNTTQSAFSRRIRALEEWVGAELVDRSTIPVSLTEAGRLFHDTALDVISALKDGRARALTTAGGVEDPIVFATTHAIAFAFFPSWVQPLTGRLGEVPMRLECHRAEKCFSALETGHAHMVLCYVPADPKAFPLSEKFLSRGVGQEVLIPVSAPHADGSPIHVLPGSKQHPCAYLSIAQGSICGGAVRRMLAERRSPPFLHTLFESPLSEAVRAMVLKGQGLAWLPKLLIGADLAAGTLVRVGGSEWEIPLEIRLFRAAGTLPAAAEQVWSLSSEA